MHSAGSTCLCVHSAVHGLLACPPINPTQLALAAIVSITADHLPCLPPSRPACPLMAPACPLMGRGPFPCLPPACMQRALRLPTSRCQVSVQCSAVHWGLWQYACTHCVCSTPAASSGVRRHATCIPPPTHTHRVHYWTAPRLKRIACPWPWQGIWTGTHLHCTAPGLDAWASAQRPARLLLYIIIAAWLNMHAAMSCNRTILAGVAKAKFVYSDGDYPIAAPTTGCNGDSTGVW